MSDLESINTFLQQPRIAVVGVSQSPNKFGSNAYRALKKNGFDLVPIHPLMSHFDQDACFPSVSLLPFDVHALFISTKPDKTLGLVTEALQKGIRHIWLQPGSANAAVLELMKNKDINVISDRCILMFAEPVTSIHSFHRFFSKAFGKYPH